MCVRVCACVCVCMCGICACVFTCVYPCVNMCMDFRALSVYLSVCTYVYVHLLHKVAMICVGITTLVLILIFIHTYNMAEITMNYILSQLKYTEWKDRYQGVTELKQLVDNNPQSYSP